MPKRAEYDPRKATLFVNGQAIHNVTDYHSAADFNTSNETGRVPWEHNRWNRDRPPFAKPRCWHCKRELEPAITVGLGAAGTQRRRYTVGCSCKPGLQESVIIERDDPIAGFCYAFEPAGAR